MIEFERWPEAESVFRGTLKRLQNYEHASVGYKAECMYWIAEALRAQKRTTQALEFTEMALAQRKERNAELELDGPFEDFGKIENRLECLHWHLKGKGDEDWLASQSHSSITSEIS